MAAVALQQTWVNLAADPSDGFGAYSAPGRESAYSRPVEVRTYAGGRTRAVSRTGESRLVSRTLRNLTSEQVQWLEDRTAALVCLRDTTGLKLFGLYGQVDASQYQDRSGWDATLTLTQVSFSEAL